MDFEIKILLITFAISVICGIITIPILKKLKVGQIERDDGPASHLKKQGTPTMGGIIMIIAIIIAVSCTYIFLHLSGNDEVAKKLLPMLLITIGYGLIGFIDDFKKLVLKNTDGLKPKYKMFGLLIIAVVYVSNFKNVYKYPRIFVYSTSNYSCTCYNKCGKSYRWN